MPSEEDIIHLFTDDDKSNDTGPNLDDTAWYLPIARYKQLVTTDSLAENVHFKHAWCRAEDIATKLFEMNASDILVKGACPQYALLNLNLKKNLANDHDFIKEFSNTLNGLCKKHGVKIIGGDTTASESSVFTMTMIGQSHRYIPRAANLENKKEYGVYLMGFTGMSQAALEALQLKKTENKQLLSYYLKPRAQWSFLEFTEKHEVIASIDQSDSLLKTLKILAGAIKRGIHIDLDLLPVHRVLAPYSESEKLRLMLTSGEDFAIVFIADEGLSGMEFHTGVSCIGRILADDDQNGVHFYKSDKIFTPEFYGFEHF